MNLNVRKIVIGLLAVGLLVSVYLAYVQVDESPLVDMDASALPSMPMDDPARGGLDRAGGRVGDVNIIGVENAEFLHTDESGRIDRRFGFAELIHSEGDQWVITNPYMVLSMGDINCRVTASKGQVEVVGSPFKREDYGIALPPESPYEEVINQTLLEMHYDGMLAELANRWFISEE